MKAHDLGTQPALREVGQTKKYSSSSPHHLNQSKKQKAKEYMDVVHTGESPVHRLLQKIAKSMSGSININSCSGDFLIRLHSSTLLPFTCRPVHI